MKLNMLPADALFVVGHNADSTKEEAHKLLPFMQEHGIKQIIVVTSNYHTRRAKKVFKEVWADSDVQFSIAAADSPKFHPAEWWKRRSSARSCFFANFTSPDSFLLASFTGIITFSSPYV